MKKIITFLISAFAFCSLIISTHATDVIIDGKKVDFTEQSGFPFIYESRTLVPLRATCEAFGATISWDAEQQTALVTNGVTTVSCKIGEYCIYRNGTKIPNDAAAIIVNNRTYLPIRAVLEALDAKVSWDGNVIVSSPGAKNTIFSIENSGIKTNNHWGAWEQAINLKNQENYLAALEAFKSLAPTFLEKSDDISDAMLFNHLGECFTKLNMKEEAAAAFLREAEKWESANLHQSALAAQRKATLTQSIVQMFVTTDDKMYTGRRYFGTKYEPKSGIYFGATLQQSNHEYMDIFSKTIEKNASGYLLYGYHDTPIETYKKSFEEAVKRNIIIQYALQPYNTYDLSTITKNDKRYIKVAKDINETGAKVFIRFASEMNDGTSDWYTENYDMYIEKFRYVADIFHQYAPNSVMVWSPNFYPPDNMEFYYPGDKYVDYVGISAYAEYAPETDPLNQNIDRNRYAAVLDKIISLYGHKKPIMVSESGASYKYVKTGEDISEFAIRNLHDFYTYLPIKYPQVSLAFLFETDDYGGRKFTFRENSEYLNTYKTAISSKAFLSTCEENAFGVPYSFELGNNVAVPPKSVNLHSYVKTFENDFAYVVYKLNGVDLGVTYQIPYTLPVDFSPYSGQTVTLTCMAFNSVGEMCANKSYNIKVESF